MSSNGLWSSGGNLGNQLVVVPSFLFLSFSFFPSFLFFLSFFLFSGVGGFPYLFLRPLPHETHICSPQLKKTYGQKGFPHFPKDLQDSPNDSSRNRAQHLSISLTVAFLSGRCRDFQPNLQPIFRFRQPTKTNPQTKPHTKLKPNPKPNLKQNKPQPNQKPT